MSKFIYLFQVILDIIAALFLAFIRLVIPFNMLLRLYSLAILAIDLSWVLMNSFYVIIITFFEFLKPPSLKNLNQETVLVIGSGRGVGREIAMQIAKLGSAVVCVDINKVTNDKTVADIKHNRGKVYGYICDVTKKENISKLAQDVRKELGFINMVFYCCGIPSPRSLLTQPPQDIHETLDLTLTSYFWIIDIFLPDMKAKNNGHIVALTSVAGLSHIPNQLPLAVAQFAVQGLAESLMEDLRISKTSNVHVTLIHIYPFITDPDNYHDLRLRLPSYFGTITPEKAASCILDSVRRNYVEASVPKHFHYLGHLLRILPRRATVLIRDLLDTGVDFA